MNIRKNNGITLMMLVVTIITLLIVAGVTISAITGGESTIDKAGQAKNETEIKAEMEELQEVITKSASKGIRHGNFSGSADSQTIRESLKKNNLIVENPDEVIIDGKSEWIVTGNKTCTKYIIENMGTVYKYIDTGNLKIGDIVNYNANVGNDGKDFTTPYTYITEEELTGSSTQSTFKSSDKMIWKVLNIDHKNGEIQLISADATSNTLTLFGHKGFINSTKILDDISSIYGHGKGAKNSRSVKIEDIEHYSNFDKSSYVYRCLWKY
ncbi:MAG: hypothetical protein IJJ82_03095 [Clostridia bacterium]|nr:hypothetical protein [Clostridia bacterium]